MAEGRQGGDSAHPLRILVVATKMPWPPRDGGRLLLATTLEGLAERGHRLTLVAPVDAAGSEGETESGGAGSLTEAGRAGGLEAVHGVPVTLASRPGALLRGLVTGTPVSILRHRHRAVLARVRQLLEGESAFDLVHVEQLQALANVPAALSGGRAIPPLVLRAQNVESDLWRALAGGASPGLRFLYRHQARRLARAEARALHRAALTLALSEEDGERLRTLAGSSTAGGAPSLEVLPAPFPEVSASSPAPTALAGDPALVILGSASWFPNREGLEWFLREIWPRTQDALPGARLHVFGLDEASALPPGVVGHPAPQDAAAAFVPGSLLVVPLRIASGIRIKILEAWARGIPVLASETSARGLRHTPGRELEVFGDQESFLNALRRRRTPQAQAQLIQAGRQALTDHHDPTQILNRQITAYRSLTPER